MTPTTDFTLDSQFCSPHGQQSHNGLHPLYFTSSSLVPPAYDGIWSDLYSQDSVVNYQLFATTTVYAFLYREQYCNSFPHPTSYDKSHLSSPDREPKPRCWEHGCNGHEFSNQSNLKRHQRERSGIAPRPKCHRCNAEFSRTTARNIHVRNDKCTKRNKLPRPVPHEILPSSNTSDQSDECVDIIVKRDSSVVDT